ncbi:MAG: hypothetical protein WD063_15230 [Pirellulales bacterium]
MAEADRLLGMYLHLARASQLRRQPMVHVKLLVLAGVQAEAMGLVEIAALCRHKILAQNAQHLVRRWPTITEALSTEPFQVYLKQLKRRYSSEKVEHMVQSLGIEMGQERAAYFSDQEYAAALLDTRVDAIADVLAGDPKSAAREGEQRPYARATRGGRDWAKRSDSRTLTNLLVVWAPFVAGLVALAALAIASRAIGP